MYFLNKISEIAKNSKIELFIDMDGVISSYDFGYPLDFKTKRPLYTNIKTLEEVSKLDNVNMHILSVCKVDKQIKEKNDWLDMYANYFKLENRHILSKETYTGIKTPDLKLKFIKEFKTDNKIIVVDDDNLILRTMKDNLDNIILFQDSELID